MKIFVGGLNAVQQQAVQKAYPDVDFVFVAITDSPRRWAATLGSADAIIIASKFNKHKHVLAMKASSKLPIRWSNGGAASVMKVIESIFNPVETTSVSTP